MILIKELLPNPLGDDAQNEWIRLINTSDKELSLNGLSLGDAGGKTFSLNNVGIISPKETVELPRTLTNIALNNDGDTVFLRNLQGEILDQLSYTSNISEEEIVTAESFIEEPPQRESLRENTLGFGEINYQPGITPILIGILIALISGILVWFAAKRGDQ